MMGKYQREELQLHYNKKLRKNYIKDSVILDIIFLFFRPVIKSQYFFKNRIYLKKCIVNTP